MSNGGEDRGGKNGVSTQRKSLKLLIPSLFPPLEIPSSDFKSSFVSSLMVKKI